MNEIRFKSRYDWLKFSDSFQFVSFLSLMVSTRTGFGDSEVLLKRKSLNFLVVEIAIVIMFSIGEVTFSEKLLDMAFYFCIT